MAPNLLWVEQHSYVQAQTLSNNAAARAYVAGQLAPGGFGLPITAVGAKRLVVGAPPWGGAAGAPLPGGGVQPRMFLLGIDAGPVALEHCSRRFPDMFIGNGPPLPVRQQAAWDALKDIAETAFDCGLHGVVVFCDANRAAPFYEAGTPAAVANGFRAVQVAAGDPRRALPGTLAHDFYDILAHIQAQCALCGVPTETDLTMNADSQVARAGVLGYQGHRVMPYGSDGDVTVNAQECFQFVHYIGTGQLILVHFRRDAWLNSHNIPPAHHADVITTLGAFDRLTDDRCTGPVRPPGWTSRLRAQATNACMLYSLNAPGGPGPGYELPFIENFMIPALVEIVAVQIPRTTATGGIFAHIAGVNTILDALDTFLPGRPNGGGTVFPNFAGITQHVVASNAIRAAWLNYTNLERQEARAYYTWALGNMF